MKITECCCVFVAFSLNVLKDRAQVRVTDMVPQTNFHSLTGLRYGTKVKYAIPQGPSKQGARYRLSNLKGEGVNTTYGAKHHEKKKGISNSAQVSKRRPAIRKYRHFKPKITFASFFQVLEMSVISQSLACDSETWRDHLFLHALSHAATLTNPNLTLSADYLNAVYF